MNKRRVVITGLGALTPIGNNVTEFWEGLISGKSGVGLITKFDTTDFATKFACEVKNFNPTDFIDVKALKRMDPFTHYALATAQMAIEDSEINLDQVNLERFGVIYGSGIGGMDTWETQHANYLNGGPRKISPFFIPMMISDIAAGHISIK